MSLLSGNHKDKKKGNKTANAKPGAKPVIKPGTGKAGGFAKKPVKTGGTRGS